MKFYAPKYKQLDLGLLRSSLDELDKTNRWVALGDLLPWTELEKEYNSRLYNQKKGAGNKPARMILGAMIIKHKLNLSDAETIEIIRESPYMQYFCGLHEFTDKPIFDPSLFVTIRKRISEEELNYMTAKLPDTARCWTGMCYFVKNVMKFLRELCLVQTEIRRIFIIIVAMRGYVRYPLSVTKN